MPREFLLSQVVPAEYLLRDPVPVGREHVTLSPTRPLAMTEPPTVRTDTPVPSQPGLAQPPVDGKYVYCIIRSDRSRDFGAIGIGGGQRVYTVHYQRPRGDRERHAARDLRPHARERARARIRERDRHAGVHRHPDVVRDGVPLRRRRHASCCARPTRRSATCSTRCRTRSSSGSRCSGIARRSSRPSSGTTTRSAGSRTRSAATPPLDVLRADAARPSGRGGAGGGVQRGTWPTFTRAQARRGREPQQQGHRRPHDPERRLPRRSHAGARSTRG